ncbi:hypothetical protein SGRA_3884 [Saprospira grandis str. Lewin]|uniref:Uncharacterized protein n=1 Tax=Saprospira grandis (strain Lewin) TaxID=984262 RepID=H6L640_SAPGL|nr:hypothetical protein SGRA_3884 [Saprospira grandis str. Lewin]
MLVKGTKVALFHCLPKLAAFFLPKSFILAQTVFIFWGLRCGFALRRYASGLAGLLGPAALRALVCGFAAPFRIARPNSAWRHSPPLFILQRSEFFSLSHG